MILAALLPRFVLWFGGSTPSAPEPPKPPPAKSDSEIQQAAADARARLRLRKGRQGTFLTSGPGVAGDQDISGQGSVVQRPTLLGGGNAGA